MFTNGGEDDQASFQSNPPPMPLAQVPGAVGVKPGETPGALTRILPGAQQFQAIYQFGGGGGASVVTRELTRQNTRHDTDVSGLQVRFVLRRVACHCFVTRMFGVVDTAISTSAGAVRPVVATSFATREVGTSIPSHAPTCKFPLDGLTQCLYRPKPTRGRYSILILLKLKPPIVANPHFNLLGILMGPASLHWGASSATPTASPGFRLS